MNLKPSNFMIGMILVTAIMLPLTLFLSNLAVNYGVSVPQKYNNTFSILTDMTAVDSQTETLKSSVMNEDEPPKTLIGEAIDIIGKYFERGYKTLQLVPQSISLFSGMIDAILDSEVAIFGTAGVSIRFIVVSGLSVAIAFLIVSALLKWWV